MGMEERKRKQKTGWRLLIHDLRAARGALALVCAYLALMYLVAGSICPLAVLTGFPCPGCGMTRAAFLLLKLDFAGAFRMHPFIYPIAASAVLFVVERYVLGKNKALWSGKLFLLCCAGMVVFYLWRMWRYFPDTAPMRYYSRNLLRRMYVWFVSG